jgi:hypothetical protein
MHSIALLKDIAIKTDQEQAIVALARAVKDERKDEVVLINAPRHSHASMGAVERVNQMLAGQVRALQRTLQASLGRRIPASRPAMPWEVRRTGWLLTRLTIRPSGHTAYEATRGRAYRGELAEIGERANAKKPGNAQNLSKLDARWEAGL